MYSLKHDYSFMLFQHLDFSESGARSQPQISLLQNHIFINFRDFLKPQVSNCIRVDGSLIRSMEDTDVSASNTPELSCLWFAPVCRYLLRVARGLLREVSMEKR